MRQYQVVLDPVRMASDGVTQDAAITAIRRGNQEAGGSVVEMAESEYIVRSTGYLKTLDDFRASPLKALAGGIPVLLGDIATIQVGPDIRRGIADLNGQAEVAGGVIILRSGENARTAITHVKAKLAELGKSLPAGVEIVPTYDRAPPTDGRFRRSLTPRSISPRLAVELLPIRLTRG